MVRISDTHELHHGRSDALIRGFTTAMVPLVERTTKEKQTFVIQIIGRTTKSIYSECILFSMRSSGTS